MKKNFSVLCRNLSLGALIVVGDSKFGMCESDIEKVEIWMEGIKKPIVDLKTKE